MKKIKTLIILIFFLSILICLSNISYAAPGYFYPKEYNVTLLNLEKKDVEKIEEIMNQQKPNQVETIKLNSKKFTKLFPKNVITDTQKEDFIIMCIEEHNKRVRNREMTL